MRHAMVAGSWWLVKTGTVSDLAQCVRNGGARYHGDCGLFG